MTDSYRDRIDDNNQRGRERSQSGRDIGPEIRKRLARINWNRRNACFGNVRLFFETYLAERFPLAWSDDHLEVIEFLQTVIHDGKQFALAMPRGSGKTSMFVGGAVYAVLYALRRFPALIGATEGAAEGLLQSINRVLEYNPLLLEDFPEVCYPLKALEGENKRVAGQHVNGTKTDMTRTKDELVLPYTLDQEGKPYPTAGITIQVCGITGQIRGLQKTLQDGSVIRPDLFLIDDPQTKASARSLSQTNTREQIVNADILGLGGPNTLTSALMACTVIEKGDLSSRTLDRQRNPQWSGKTYRMMKSMPTNQDLWDKYDEIRKEDLRADKGRIRADQFYLDNRKLMDEGAVASWPQYTKGNISAVQLAMHLKSDTPYAWAAEYQNDPLDQNQGGEAQALDPNQVIEKLSKVPHLLVPAGHEKITAALDLGQDLLWWVVISWDDQFGGSIIDYGVFPDQPSRYFTRQNPSKTLADEFPNISLEAQLHLGMKTVAERLLNKQYKLQSGEGFLQIEKMLIDCAWGQHRDDVHKYCRNSGFANRVMPAWGEGCGPLKRFDDYRRVPGETTGTAWRIKAPDKRYVKAVKFESNYWKTFIAERFRTIEGSFGSLSLYGSKPDPHDQFSQHMAGEKPVRVSANGRTVDEWKEQPGHDHDWFDCVYMSAVAAAITGTKFSPTGEVEMAPPRPTVRYTDKVKAYREGRPTSETPAALPTQQASNATATKRTAFSDRQKEFRASKAGDRPQYRNGRRVL
jgi:hypothetical protein